MLDSDEQKDSAQPGKFGLTAAALFRKLLFLIPVGIIGNLVYCFLTTDTRMIASVVQVHPGYLLVAALFAVVPWFTGSLRLYIWSRFLKQPVPYRDAFSIAIAADLGAAIAPPMIGGSAVKIGMLVNRGIHAGTALSLPALENIEDFLCFLVLVPAGFALTSQPVLPFDGTRLPYGTWKILAGALACSLLLVLLAMVLKRSTRLETFRIKIKQTLGSFLNTFQTIGKDGRHLLLLTLALTLVQWICRYSIISLLLAGLGISVQPVLFMVLQIMVFALNVLIPTPGGSGGAEAFFALLYNPYLPAGSMGLVTTAWRFLTFYFHTLLAAVLFLLLDAYQVRRLKSGKADRQKTGDEDVSLLVKDSLVVD